jgi:hypothetical protein
MVGVEVALDLHNNPLILIRGLLITATRNALLYCRASELCFPLAMINGSWSLTCMGINIPIATEQLNQFVTSSAPLLTFSLVVGILPFHLLFCKLNKLGKPYFKAGVTDADMSDFFDDTTGAPLEADDNLLDAGEVEGHDVVATREEELVQPVDVPAIVTTTTTATTSTSGCWASTNCAGNQSSTIAPSI